MNKTEKQKRTVQTYRVSSKEIFASAMMALAAGIILAVLMYADFRALFLCPLFFPVFLKSRKKRGKAILQEKLRTQFLDAVQAVSTALSAGYSLENAWKEAQVEMEALYGRNSIIATEFRYMNRQVQMQSALENILLEFGERTGNEDIQTFAEVIYYAKRSSGNLVHIMENTIDLMRQKEETQKEIQLLAAARELEMKILEIMPIGILAYLRLTFGDYLEVLYHNLAGVCFMTGCMGAYFLSIRISKSILTIKI